MTTRAYIRASTDKQETSPDRQRETILDYCRRAGVPEPLPGGWYVDRGVSGSKRRFSTRPAAARLLADLEKGDMVLVDALDRISRHKNGLDVYVALNCMQERGAQLHIAQFSNGEGIDTSTVDGMAVLFGHSLVAMAEATQISYRTRTGMQRAAASGKVFGGYPPAGWEFVGDGKNRTLRIIPGHERAVQTIEQMLTAGHKPTAIVRALNRAQIPRVVRLGKKRRAAEGQAVIVREWTRNDILNYRRKRLAEMANSR